MNHPVYIHRYTLRSRALLNARTSRQEFQGVLIQVDGGYGCIHPWPELGDAPLDQQLIWLQDGGNSPLIRLAMNCAKADGHARRDGQSLFDGVKVPQSHATLPMDQEAFAVAVEAGFDRVKVKMGREMAKELIFVQEMAALYPQLRWRIDFNNSQSMDSIKALLNRWPEVLRRKIDFLEDAYVRGDVIGMTSHLGAIPLAVDREVESPPADFPVWVIKPAINEVPLSLAAAVSEKKRVVITSYMDHPLGQSYAAWQAALAVKKAPDAVDICGLVTHGLFQPDLFTESLGRPSPFFKPADGTGLGFDSLLAELPWKRIN